MKILFVNDHLAGGRHRHLPLQTLLQELAGDKTISADLLLFHADEDTVRDVPSFRPGHTANALADLIAVSQQESREKGLHLWLAALLTLGGLTKLLGHCPSL
jgi:hypothetical protein